MRSEAIDGLKVWVWFVVTVGVLVVGGTGIFVCIRRLIS